MRFFLFFLSYGPGGPKWPETVFRKRPGHTVNAPGRLFTPARSQRPGGALAGIITVFEEAVFQHISTFFFSEAAIIHCVPGFSRRLP